MKEAALSLRRFIYEKWRNLFLALVRRNNRRACSVLEQLDPHVVMHREGRRFLFHTPNTPCLWRAETLFTKEPETLAWIDRFEDDAVFYDVGANVGVYSIYAAVSKPRLQVLAFEPASFSQAVLNRNILLNGLERRVRALPLALSEQTGLDSLYIPEPVAGVSMVNLGCPSQVNGRPVPHCFSQGVLAFSLDRFLEEFHPPFPNHIKIDVDGLEGAILRGARKTLADPRLRSIAVEMNEDLDDHRSISQFLGTLGLEMMGKIRVPVSAGSSYQKIYNGVFARYKCAPRDERQ